MKLNGVGFKISVLYRPTFDSAGTTVFRVVGECIVLRSKWFVHAFLVILTFIHSTSELCTQCKYFMYQ